MTVFGSGPINIQQGNSAGFTIEFISSVGERSSPSSAYITISYNNLSNVEVTETIDLAALDSFYTATWSSTSATTGLATWEVISAASTAVQSSGQIRIIQRQSTY